MHLKEADENAKCTKLFTQTTPCDLVRFSGAFQYWLFCANLTIPVPTSATCPKTTEAEGDFKSSTSPRDAAWVKNDTQLSKAIEVLKKEVAQKSKKLGKAIYKTHRKK